MAPECENPTGAAWLQPAPTWLTESKCSEREKAGAIVWKFLVRKSEPARPPPTQVPAQRLALTKAEAMTRQIEGAIEALVLGRFDIAITQPAPLRI